MRSSPCASAAAWARRGCSRFIEFASGVIAGLDPAIHLNDSIAKAMDARVKPAHDEGETHGPSLHTGRKRVRDEVRTFFKENLPDGIRKKAAEGIRYVKDDIVTWQRILNKKGWAVPHWPKEWGGTGWSPVQLYIFKEEMQQAPAPEPLPFGTMMLAPVILAFGREDQKKSICRASANLDDWWCQGFSEPGAGSDLASLKTSAKREGDSTSSTGRRPGRPARNTPTGSSALPHGHVGEEAGRASPSFSST
jgi:hypothetical protein